MKKEYKNETRQTIQRDPTNPEPHLDSGYEGDDTSDNQKCCIYKITNILNGRVYIGSSINYKNRKRTHLSCLRYNHHYNLFLQNDFNKCKENNFIFEILELVDKKNILEYEQKYINQYYDNQKQCYNLKKSAIYHVNYERNTLQKQKNADLIKNISWDERFGIEKSTEIKKRLSKSLKGKPGKQLFGENNSFFGKKHTLETKKLISKGNTGRLIGEKNPMYGRYGNLHPFYGRSGSLHHNSKKVNQINVETNEIIKIFASINIASKETGADVSCIVRCCKNKQKTSLGFGWSYVEE